MKMKVDNKEKLFREGDSQQGEAEVGIIGDAEGNSGQPPFRRN